MGDWTGRQTSGRIRRERVVKHRGLRDEEDPHNCKAKVEIKIPKGALSLDEVRQLLEDHPDAGPDNRIALKGKVIGDWSLTSLGKDGISKLDFSGAKLQYARLGTVPQWDEFKYNRFTTFPDTLDETIVAVAEKKHGITMKLGPVINHAAPHATL